mmetsp:Transcript_631/g.759  ORF Transcript_631/g.759 Transcript_631/m.759 type:complete len:200 (-) Transcript_631:97-696(-)
MTDAPSIEPTSVLGGQPSNHLFVESLPEDPEIFSSITLVGNYILKQNHTISFHPGGVLNVTGCFKPAGNLVLHGTRTMAFEEVVLVHYNCYDPADGGFSDVDVSQGDQCKTVENNQVYKPSKFSVVLRIRSKCLHWWGYMLIALTVTVIAVAIAIGILVVFVPRFRALFFPFEFHLKSSNDGNTSTPATKAKGSIEDVN